MTEQSHNSSASMQGSVVHTTVKKRPGNRSVWLFGSSLASGPQRHLEFGPFGDWAMCGKDRSGGLAGSRHPVSTGQQGIPEEDFMTRNPMKDHP